MSTHLEQNRKPGVHYALAPHGPDELELPVIDVTHPAFALALTEEEIAARVASAPPSRCDQASGGVSG